MLVRGGKAVQLSNAHTADAPLEQERINSLNPTPLRHVGNRWPVGPAALQVTSCVDVNGSC